MTTTKDEPPEERQQVDDHTRDLEAWNQRIVAIAARLAARGAEQAAAIEAALGELRTAMAEEGVELLLVAQTQGLPDTLIEADELFP